MHLVYSSCEGNATAASRNTSIGIQIRATQHVCALMPPAHTGHGRLNIQNKEVIIYQLAFVVSHMKQASLRVNSGIQYMKSSYIPVMYKLYKSYSQGTIIFASSFVNSFYTELHMNQTYCAVYCGLNHKEWSKRSPQPT
jgi:hypothetical protein